MFSAQWAAVSTTIGEITVPEQAVDCTTLATNASHCHVPAVAVPPSITAMWAVGGRR